MSKSTKKATYRIRNWAEYDQALVRRGSLTIRADQEALDDWDHQGPPRWGSRFVYSDTAIRCLLTIRAVFHLPLPSVLPYLRRTVEKVDSIGLVDRMWTQCSAGKS